MEVLIVEDNEDVRECLFEVLSTRYQVKAVENGLAALKLIEAEPHRFDVMLLDMVMPVMDGLTLLQELAEDGRYIPTVIISATKPTDVGRITWLSKPFELDHLFDAIDSSAALRGVRVSL